VVQALLPPGLTVDTYPNVAGVERAWIGVVPFGMRGIRPRGVLALPWISGFLETNVRTYVHCNGEDPGVWFFSLEAARWLACAYARAAYRLPYHHANMRMDRQGDQVSYQTVRFGDGSHLRTSYAIGEPIEVQSGSFEFWLVERYRLYSATGSSVFSGVVNHAPYSLRAATLINWETNLPSVAGLPNGDPEHVGFSPGVKVDVWKLLPIDGGL
jgi:uncharacterized protein YqjF (DUF2071 family)